MKSVGDWVALVCFISLALLGWWVLVNGFSWPVAAAGTWWLLLGAAAAMKPDEWKKKDATGTKG